MSINVNVHRFLLVLYIIPTTNTFRTLEYEFKYYLVDSAERTKLKLLTTNLQGVKNIITLISGGSRGSVINNQATAQLELPYLLSSSLLPVP
jgi:hypothetical protein